MRIHQQDIVNAICIHMAERKQVKPEDVQVELLWDENLGYSAEVTIHGRSQYLVEATLIEAILQYVWSYYNVRAFKDQVTFDVEDEMFADIQMG